MEENRLFTGSFYDHPPTDDKGTMLETHGVVIENGRIKRQIVGDGGFPLPNWERVDWKMPFPTDIPTPDPIVS